MGTAYHPQSSGQVERFNQMLSQTLRCTVHSLGDSSQWRRVLSSVEFAVNSTPNMMTGYTGFFLNYGYHPVTPVQLLDSDVSSKVESVGEYLQRLRTIFLLAQEQIKRVNNEMKKFADRRRTSKQYAIGDYVRLNTKNLRFKGIPNKFRQRVIGPLKIVQRIGQAAYKVNLPQKYQRLHPVFHVSLLEPWHQSRFAHECYVNFFD